MLYFYLLTEIKIKNENNINIVLMREKESDKRTLFQNLYTFSTK